MVLRERSIAGTVYHGDPEEEENDNIKKSAGTGTEIVRETSNDSSYASTSARGNHPAIKLSSGVLKHFKDERFSQDLAHAVETEPDSENPTQARSLDGFFSVFALCHTVLTAVDPATGAIEYKAQSPDEAALVQATADVRFIFRGREQEILLLQTPFLKKTERFELLTDNVIFERLKPGADDLKRTTEAHLEDFANAGLRTFTLAYKVIQDDEFEAWAERYHEASTTLDDCEGKIEEVCDEMERELRLLGATDIEDCLHDGVPETIADLKVAGIKVWVATGDKLETAIAIGRSTNLLAEESNIIIIRSSDCVQQQMIQAVEAFFLESGILDEHGLVTCAPKSPSAESSRTFPMRRLSTGVRDIVGDDNGDRHGGFVLVIDGAALDHALPDEDRKTLLIRLATQCEGVITSCSWSLILRS